MNPKILPFAKSSFVRDIGYAENGPGTGYAKKTWSFSNAATGYSETAIGYADFAVPGKVGWVVYRSESRYLFRESFLFLYLANLFLGIQLGFPSCSRRQEPSRRVSAAYIKYL